MYRIYFVCTYCELRQIRTFMDGIYHDQVMGNKFQWKKHQEITLEEIITYDIYNVFIMNWLNVIITIFRLKLYTDFDKLQHHLKKVRFFRIVC